MQGMGEEHGEDGMALREGGSGQPQAPAQWPQPGLSPRPRVFLCRSDCEPDARPLCRVSENSPAPTAPPTLGLGPELSGADIHCLAGPC